MRRLGFGFIAPKICRCFRALDLRSVGQMTNALPFPDPVMYVRAFVRCVGRLRLEWDDAGTIALMRPPVVLARPSVVLLDHPSASGVSSATAAPPPPPSCGQMGLFCLPPLPSPLTATPPR